MINNCSLVWLDIIYLDFMRSLLLTSHKKKAKVFIIFVSICWFIIYVFRNTKSTEDNQSKHWALWLLWFWPCLLTVQLEVSARSFVILTRKENRSHTWRDFSALNNYFMIYHVMYDRVYRSRGFYLQCNAFILTGLTAAISSCSSCEVSAPTASLLTVQMTLELMTPNKNKKGFTSYLRSNNWTVATF